MNARLLHSRDRDAIVGRVPEPMADHRSNDLETAAALEHHRVDDGWDDRPSIDEYEDLDTCGRCGNYLLPSDPGLCPLCREDTT
jgi:hypothetical protein